MISASLLIVTNLVVALTAVGLALVVVVAKLGRARRERTTRTVVTPHRLPLLVVGSGEDDDGAALAHLLSVDSRTWRRLGAAVVALLSKVRGAPAEDLVLVLREHGEVEWAGLRGGTHVWGTMTRQGFDEADRQPERSGV